METVFDARAMHRRGLVLSIDDSGPVQTCTVQTSAGHIYKDVEVIQPYGHASVPPGDGCTALLLAIGGDPANMVALLTNPSQRMGNLAQGESTLYNARNNARVAVRANGVIDILSGNVVNITAPNVAITSTGSVTITAAALTVNGNATINGGLTVEGAITSTGSIHAGGGVH